MKYYRITYYDAVLSRTLVSTVQSHSAFEAEAYFKLVYRNRNCRLQGVELIK